MPSPLTEFITSCALITRRFVQVLVGSDSQSQRSTSTRKPTPMTAFDTSAKSVTKQSVASRSPHLTDGQALAAGSQIVENWRAGGKDDESLSHLIAEVLLALTDRSAHLGTIATMSEVMYAHSLLNTPEGAEKLHLKLVEQSTIADDLVMTLQDLEQVMILLATATNEVLALSQQDEELQKKATALRDASLLADEHIRTTLGRYTNHV